MSMTRVFNLSMQIWSTVMSLVIILCLFVPNRMKRKTDRLYVEMLVFHIGLMMMDALALYFRGRLGFVNSVGVRTSNFLSFLSGNFLVYAFIKFEKVYLERKLNRPIKTKVLKVSTVLLIVQCALLVLNLVVPFIYQIDKYNIYSRLPGYPANFLLQFSVAAMALCLLWEYRDALDRWEIASFLIYILMPFFTMILTILHYGIAFVHLGNSIALIVMYVYLQAENGRREAEKEKDLVQMRVAIMMSQIQPHFLFNALNSIEYLCDSGSPDAGATVHHFAQYLRGNMESVTMTAPISFDKELAHLKNYLYIEHIRFPQIEVVYDLKVNDFSIPVLTIQPLVENAIKHGLSDKEEDAVVQVETYEDEENVYVRISDNGCGFDPERKPSDGRTHVGLENVRNRLQMICAGTLKITSERDKGTIALVTLPKN